VSEHLVLMAPLDILCLVLIAAWLVVDHLVVWRSFLRRSHAEQPRARLWLYEALVAELWTGVALVVSLWLYEGRSWTLLRLNVPDGWRLWVSVGSVLAVIVALGATTVRLERLTRRKRVRMSTEAAARAPHTKHELAWWAAVSVSAGLAEELIFRGYLIWALQPLLGLWGAAVLSLVVFAVAHAYQGAAGVVATGVVGGLLTLVVLVFGSLWPAVAIHLLIDLQQGFAAWLVLRKQPHPVPSST
jgi:membrane protease YdiL (CAAX protease family)